MLRIPGEIDFDMTQETDVDGNENSCKVTSDHNVDNENDVDTDINDASKEISEDNM